MLKKLGALLLTVCMMGVAPYDTLPLNIPNITAWYDFGDNATITEAGGLVSQVLDKSGNANTLTQLTPVLSPTVATTFGYQGLAYNGTASQSMVTSSVNTFASGTSPDTIFVVAASNTVNGDIASGGDTVGNANRRVRTTAARNFQSINNGTTVIGGTFNATINQGFAVRSTSSTTASVNGGANIVSLITLNTTAGTPFVLGNRPNLSSAFNGTIYELIVYNRFLDINEYRLVQGYLACKYNIQSLMPANHPFRNICPYFPNPLTLGG